MDTESVHQKKSSGVDQAGIAPTFIHYIFPEQKCRGGVLLSKRGVIVLAVDVELCGVFIMNVLMADKSYCFGKTAVMRLLMRPASVASPVLLAISP